MKNMNKWRWATIVLTLALVVLSPLTIIYSQNLATLRTILNDVWDRENDRIMTTSWAGAQGTFETEITIFNDVWDKDNHLLRTSGGGGGSPGGSNTQVQYNDSGSFGGDAGLTFNETTNVLTATGGFVGSLTGNADTATALAANPTDCGAGEFANAIAANGNLTCATPAGGGTITAVWTDSSGDVSALTAAAGDTIDATLADSTKPVKAGTTPPSTCTADKDLFIDTDTSPAGSLLLCNPTGDGWVYAVPVGVPDPGSNGIVARINSTPNTAARTITGTASVITVTNGDGVSGNPTINTGANVPTLAPTDDNAIVGNGTAWQLKALPDCDDTGGNHLNYDTATNAFVCGTSGAAGTGYATVQDEGTPLTARGTLNFVGAGVSCVDDTTRTNCTISGGGGGGTTQPGIQNARLTLQSGVAYPTTDQTAKTSVYVTPYKGDVITTYDSGSAWAHHTFTEQTITVPATTDTIYDVFCWYTGAAVECFADSTTDWANSAAGTSSRGTGAGTPELTYQNGVPVNANAISGKCGAKACTYYGSFRTTGVSGQTEDSWLATYPAKRYVWNYWHKRDDAVRVIEPTNTWTYSTATTRQANGSANNQIEVLCGIAGECPISIVVSATNTVSTSSTVLTGIGENSTTTPVAANIGLQNTAFSAGGGGNIFTSHYAGQVPLGYNYYAWLEKGAGSGTQTWYGDNNNPATIQSGMLARWER